MTDASIRLSQNVQTVDPVRFSSRTSFSLEDEFLDTTDG